MSTAIENNQKKAPRPSKEVRIANILKSARAVFEQQGYEKAKVSDIAARIGIVEGTIFHHFGSKQDLVNKVIEGFYDEISVELQKGLQGIQGTRNQFYFIIWFHYKVLIQNSALCRVILNESRKEVQSELKDDIRLFYRKYISFINQVYKDGVANGDIRGDVSISLIRNTIYGSIENAMWVFIADGHPINIEQASEDLTNLVFRGISTQTEELKNSEVVALIKKLNKLM